MRKLPPKQKSLYWQKEKLKKKKQIIKEIKLREKNSRTNLN